jgi:hypothetical protein
MAAAPATDEISSRPQGREGDHVADRRLSVNSMTSRSMPMPSPPQGGSPYSSAVT